MRALNTEGELVVGFGPTSLQVFPLSLFLCGDDAFQHLMFLLTVEHGVLAAVFDFGHVPNEITEIKGSRVSIITQCSDSLDNVPTINESLGKGELGGTSRNGSRGYG